MGLVDTAVVGRLSAVDLAGVGLANGLFFTISNLGMGTMLGLDPLVSQALGAGEPGRARRLMWQGLWLALLVSLVLAVPLALAPTLLVPFGVEAEAAERARTYLHIRILGLFPFFAYFGVRAYLQALGITRPMIVSMVIANFVNALASVLLVLGGGILPEWAGPLRELPSLGVAGAAWATNLCLAVQLGIVVLAIRKLHAATGTTSRRPERRAIGQALRVGMPVGLQLSTEVAIFALVGLLAGRMGAQQMAAHQVSLMLASMTFTVAVGIASAGSVRVGRAIGAGDPEATRRAGHTAFFTGGAFMGVAGLAFLLIPHALASLLTDDPSVIAAAAPLLAIAALFAVSDGVQAVGAGVLRGAGDTRFPFVASLFGHWLVGLPVALWLSPRLGVQGLWFGLSAGLTVVAIALFRRFHRLSAQPIRPLVGAEGPREAA